VAIDVYLQIDGIRGESADDKHKDWIECKSVSWAVSQPKSATASFRPIVARFPKLRYRNGAGGDFPFSLPAITRATYAPCCLATGATPGSGP
jgi:hypothetical protein